MYLGGQVVLAADCNYESAKTLGLKCPFCDSAIFLRSQSIRKIKGKEKLVGPYFAHYPCGNGDPLDCEKRSISKQGRLIIEQTEIKARNQRLKIYNAHLWEIICDGLYLPKNALNPLRQLVDSDWVEKKSISLRKEWYNNLPQLYEWIDHTINHLKTLPEWQQNVHKYVNSMDKRDKSCVASKIPTNIALYQAIVNEVIGFLASDSAGYVFLKMFKLGLLMLHLADSKALQMGIKQDMPMAYYSMPMCFMICTVDWVKQINKYLPNKE